LEAKKQLGVVSRFAHAPEMEKDLASTRDLPSFESLWLAVLDEPNKFVPMVETHEERSAELPSIIVAQQVRERKQVS
jgi:hypothetical protein